MLAQLAQIKGLDVFQVGEEQGANLLALSTSIIFQELLPVFVILLQELAHVSNFPILLLNHEVKLLDKEQELGEKTHFKSRHC